MASTSHSHQSKLPVKQSGLNAELIRNEEVILKEEESDSEEESEEMETYPEVSVQDTCMKAAKMGSLQEV